MSLNHRRVFIAGATGLAGSSIIKHILANYHDVQVVATYYHTKPFIQDKRIIYVRADLRCLEDCCTAAKGCDFAIMSAAITANAGVFSSSPWSVIHDNVSMNTRMLEAFHKENIKRVVYIGSATLYQPFGQPIREDELCFEIDPPKTYFGVGWANRFIEKVCRFWHENTSMEIMIARAANIYGPFAKFDPQNSNFIPAIIRKAVDRMEPFEVWGSPEVARDVIYAEDFARAIIAMLGKAELGCEVFNIGSGQTVKVGEVVELAFKHSGHIPNKVNYITDKPTTVQYRVLDCTKAQEILKWQPAYSVDQGIRNTVNWWKENKAWWQR